MCIHSYFAVSELEIVLSNIFCTDMAQQQLGKTCATVRLTSDNLANCNMQKVPTKEITNGVIVELIII